MIRRPPRSTLSSSSAASDVYKRQVLQRAVGCSSCGKTGYRGRFAIHEVLLLSEELERMIIERRSTDDLVKVAVMEGMISLKKDGLRKVGLGLTSLEEIFRVVA